MRTALLTRSPRAKQDIKEVLAYTRENWGQAKAWEYSELIQEALEVIASDPYRGRPTAAARAGVYGYHIKQPGRNARHIIFYRIGANGTVQIIRFLHDSMDFDLHLSK